MQAQRLSASNATLGRSLADRLPPFELIADEPDATFLEHSETRLQDTYRPDEHTLQPARECCRTFRHSSWARTRWAIYHALRRTGVDERVLHRFEQCGQFMTVWSDPASPDRYQVRGNFCKHRYCLPCAQNRSRLIASNIHHAIDGQVVRFITLTLKHTDQPLADQIDALGTYFTRLRRRTFWIQHVTAGAWFLELTYNREADRWHPHLHVIVRGRYMPHEGLRGAWHDVTKASFIVDIRLVRDPDRAAAYVSKYASKPMATDYVKHEDRLDEAVAALHGRRMCGTFGDWRNLRLTELPEDDTDWHFVGNLGILIIRAKQGDSTAREIVTTIQSQRGIDCLTIAPP